MIFAFILAKLVATVAGAVLASSHSDLERLIVTLASITSMVIFVLLVMLGGKQSIAQVVAATAALHKPKGSLFLWLAVAFVAGLAFRFGISGVVLGVLQVVDPQSIATELNELAAARNDPTLPLDVLAFLLVLIDATNEEIVYRRILQTYFRARYGLVIGVIGVAMAFGAIHASIPAALVGLWLGLLYLFTGRLWVAAVAHAVGNLGVFAMAAMQQPGMQGLYLVTCYVAAALMVVTMVLITRSIRKAPWCPGNQ